MRPRVVLAPLAVLLVGGVLWLALPTGRGGAAPPTSPAADPVRKAPAAPRESEEEFDVAPVRVEMVPRVESFPARVRAPDATEIHTTLRNTPVEEVLVRRGQAVKKGDLLVKMNGASLERALEAAKKSGDAATEAKARDALANLEVRSPVDGVVHLVEASRGEIPIVAKKGPLPLLVLFDWTRLSFDGTAPGPVAGFLTDDAELFVNVGTGRPARAMIVKRSAPAPDGSVAIEAVPLDPPPVAPASGTTVMLEVRTGQSEAFVVDRAAIREEGGRTVVDVVDAARRRTVRPVVVGGEAPSGRVAVSGVDRLEQVAVWRRKSPVPPAQR
jgi:hypothetical protein